jgi:malate dehydrogenase (oxaloacetate-decarboxylating)
MMTVARRGARPPLPPAAKTSPPGGDFFATSARGLEVLNSPLLNKGTAFTEEERKSLQLNGLLPPEVRSLAAQVAGAYIQYEQLPDALSKNNYLTALHDRNEVLFFSLVSAHLREMISIAGDLTVGMTMVHYRHECRPARGIYLSIDHPISIDEAFANFGALPGDVDLILATDAEQIQGIGDGGAGGMEVSIGKLAIYTAAGGINPRRMIPVMLDVGTNRESLLADPMYMGNRHPRIRGARYEAFIDSYIRGVTRLFPNALLQWADFAPSNGRNILRTYREQVCTFNDDMQGTGAIVLAAAISAVRACGVPLRKQRVVVFGAGTAGVGVASQLCEAMMREGLSREEALSRFWLVDQQGLLTSDMADTLHDYQRPFVRPRLEVSRWKTDENGTGIDLAEVVRRVRPTMLIGTSASPGNFTESIIKNMTANTERPILFVLSTPAARAEAKPSDLIAWTNGQALIATGSAFPPVTHRGVTYVIAHASSATLYPGLGLGVIVSQASKISEAMIAAAANAVSSLVTVRQPGASLLPQMEDLRSVSATVAVAVAEMAEFEGLARASLDDVVKKVHDAMWRPEYRPIRAV